MPSDLHVSFKSRDSNFFPGQNVEILVYQERKKKKKKKKKESFFLEKTSREISGSSIRLLI